MNVTKQETSAGQPDQATLLGVLRDARERLEIFQKRQDERVAIIGLSGRFPGADDVDSFWKLLAGGDTGLTPVTEADLDNAGIDPAVSGEANYVRVWGGFNDPTGFDAGFFGYSPREAQLLDPQQRVFLECAWNAFEHAGYGALKSRGRTGVYAGGSLNYHFTHIQTEPSLRDNVAPLQAGLGNVSGMIASRVAYHLNLEGPSVGIQATCATGLVSVHLAVRALLQGECEMAVAGAVSVGQSRPAGYVHEAGGIGSPDGQCRPFDADANGTIFTNGVGAVILKRLGDAMAAGDKIYAVIAGSAIGNDGSSKVGLTAPSVKGQAAVLKNALADAGIPASAVDYVEAHATATAIGDPIELTALNRIYGPSLLADGRTCHIGSLKGNVGHMDAAAGIGGLIKAVLALRHECLPASGNFRAPSSACDFEKGPFRVLAHKQDWKPEPGRQRRAAISAFGMGGSNAHVIIEEAPARETAGTGETTAMQLLPLSARTATSLAAMQGSLADALAKDVTGEAPSLADVAHTLQKGREAFSHRSVVLAGTLSEASARLAASSGAGFATGTTLPHEPDLVFMFPGQGSQHVGMAGALYRQEPHFRAALDDCLALIPDALDIGRLLLSETGAPDAGLDRTDRTQPALFAVEYALARMWMQKGLRPRAMIGHSVGEYVAACLAGVFSLEDAMKLVVGRGRLMQACAPGAMLSVVLPEAQARLKLVDGLEIAAVNGPGSCVIAGDTDALHQLAKQLEDEGTGCRMLRTSHAFHSAAMDPVLGEFMSLFDGVRLAAPAIDIMSNLSGNWLTADEARNPAYWAEHLRRTVNFNGGMERLLALPAPVLLEVGPGSTLCRLARQQAHDNCRTIASLPEPAGSTDAADHALLAFGQLWIAGVDVPWDALHDGAARRRVGLPGYHFERQSYWVAPPKNGQEVAAAAVRRPVGEWFHQPVWKTRSLRANTSRLSPQRWLVMAAEGLLDVPDGIDAVLVGTGSEYRLSDGTCTIDPAKPEHLAALFDDLERQGRFPDQIVCGVGLSGSDDRNAGWDFAFSLARTLAAGSRRPNITFVGRSMNRIFGADIADPAQARINGIVRMLGQEIPGISCRSIDLQEAHGKTAAKGLRHFVAAPFVEGEQIHALRDGILLVLTHEPMAVDLDAGAVFNAGETYLVTGELIGGLALVYARAILKAGARVILAGKSGLPLVPDWERWLASHSPQHPISLFIQALRSLGRPGQDFVVFAGDITDADWLGASLEEGERRLGRLKGVFHTAAMGDQYFALLASDNVDVRALRAVKSGSITALDKVIGARDDIFVLVQSSLSSIVGGTGLASYAAENCYLDAFVEARQGKAGPTWKSINWDACASVHANEVQSEDSEEISSDDVWHISRAVLAEPTASSFVVTPYDLATRAKARDHGMGETPKAGGKSARNGVSAAYAPPQGPVVEEIVAIMAELLGIEGIGAADNFFELGGHSLLAIQVVARLRKRFDVEIPMRALLFDAPTAAGLARVVQAGLDARRNEADILSALLDEVEADG